MSPITVACSVFENKASKNISGCGVKCVVNMYCWKGENQIDAYKAVNNYLACRKENDAAQNYLPDIILPAANRFCLDLGSGVHDGSFFPIR